VEKTPHPALRATFSHKGPVALSAFEAEDVRREGLGPGNACEDL